jgi:hypothetical protein
VLTKHLKAAKYKGENSMSRIHGLRAIINETIENKSIRGVTGDYYGITDDKLAIIVNYGKVEAGAISGGKSGGSIGFDGFDISFGENFTTDGGAISFTGATAGSTLILPESGTLVNQEYVDSFVQGLDLKASVRAASTENIALSGATGLTLDGVALVTGNRVLLKDQTNPVENGIYVVTTDGSTSYSLARSTDCDGTPENEVSGGLYTFVETGTQGGYGFVVIHDGNVAVGTDAINFSLFSSAGAYSGTDGITINSSVISIDATYWDDVQAANTLDLAGLIGATAGAGATATGGLTTAVLQELTNAITQAGCTYEDFETLANITTSEINLSDVVTYTALGATGATAGAEYVGVAPIAGMTAANVQEALENLDSRIGTVAGATDIVDFEQVIVSVAGATGEPLAGVMTYSTDFAFIAESLKVYVNGVLMSKDATLSEYVSEDVGLTSFTFNSFDTDDIGVGAIGAGDEIIVSYRKSGL